MNKFVVATLLSLASSAYGQDQVECAAQLDAKMKEMGALTSAQAGQVTYTKLFERAKRCVEGGLCAKADAFIAISEMMVNEEVVKLQRQKIALLKAFFVKARPYENDACALVQRFPPLLNQISALNEKQLAIFFRLSEERFP